MLEVNIFLPYLYTRVRCCGAGPGATPLGEQYDVRADLEVRAIREEAAAQGLAIEGGASIAACAVPAFPASSRQWSLSPFCGNRAFVEDRAQRVVGINGPLQKLAGLAVLPVGGAVADAVGRRPVLIAYAVVLMAACFLYALDAAVQSSYGDVGLYLAGALLCVSWDPKDNVVNGAVSDMVSGEADRGRAFAFIVALNSVGMVVGFMASFFCLRMHLENYLLPWLFFACIGMGIFGFLALGMPETYPAHLRSPVTTSMLNPLSSHLRNFSLISRDRVLVGLTALHFLLMFHFVGFITQGFSYLLLMGFSMEEAVLPGVVGSMAQVAWSFVVMFALPRLGVRTCYISGHAMFAVAYLFWGPYTVMIGRSGPYIGNVAQGAAFALIIPSMQAIISQRVEKDNQSKSFSAVSAVSTVGCMLGMAFYSGVLFSGTATGMMRALPAIVSACLALACTVLAAVLFLVVPAGGHAGESCPEPSKHRSGP
ncbi:unnamed protein product [Prorocentrum cordatum]|uniref:Major facilitator superfamily (MFS) profile domain-containing protein n=1 Tax=Prorocentrum cordatum TaxID=2364126 RepID=A0ABN9Q7F8_9DINO|nr:unnamed protein product [Polarella glacialis]